MSGIWQNLKYGVQAGISPRVSLALHWLLLISLLAGVMIAGSGGEADEPEAGRAIRRVADGPVEGGRVVVVVIDSLRPDLVSPERMPLLHALSEAHSFILVETCAANFTLPCMRELFEGTVSPFSASIHNLSGATGGRINAVSLAVWAGLRARTVGDEVLWSLYGSQATQAVDTRESGSTYLLRDFAAVSKAVELLEETEFLALHLYGTDKVAHFDRPGSAAYNQYFLDVDEALASLWSRLDPQRDHLIVTGDHGHNDDGHHITQSAVVAFGPRFGPLIQSAGEHGLQQRDLFQWMLAALGQVPPDAFSGRWVLANADWLTSGDGQEQRFWRAYEQAVASTFGLVPNASRAEIVAALEAKRQWQKAAGFRTLGEHWHLFALYTLAALALVAVRMPAARGRATVAFGLVIAAGGLFGWLAHPWADLMHSVTGSVGLRTALFYGAMPAAGWLLARGTSSPAAWVPLSVFVVTTVLPSGPYSYQVGQNWTWPLLVGIAVSRIIERKIAAADWPALLTAGLLLVQECGGWVYQYYPTQWLDPHLSASWLAALAVSGALWWVSGRSIAVVAAAVGWVAYGAFYVEISPARSASGLLPVVLFLAWVRAERSRLELPGALPAAGAYAAVAAAGMLQSMWLLTDGFFLQNIDFAFTAPIVDIFGDFGSIPFVWVLCTLKYMGPALLMLWGYTQLTGRPAWPVAHWAATLLLLKLGALLWQLHLGALREDATLHEVAVAEFGLVWALCFTALAAAIPTMWKTGPALAAAHGVRQAPTTAQ